MKIVTKDRKKGWDDPQLKAYLPSIRWKFIQHQFAFFLSTKRWIISLLCKIRLPKSLLIKHDGKWKQTNFHCLLKMQNQKNIDIQIQWVLAVYSTNSMLRCHLTHKCNLSTKYTQINLLICFRCGCCRYGSSIVVNLGIKPFMG